MMSYIFTIGLTCAMLYIVLMRWKPSDIFLNFVLLFILWQFTFFSEFPEFANRTSIQWIINQFLLTSIFLPGALTVFNPKNSITQISEIVLTSNILIIPLIALYYNENSIHNFNSIELIIFYIVTLLPSIFWLRYFKKNNNFTITQRGIFFTANLILEWTIFIALWESLRIKILEWTIDYIDFFFILPYASFIINYIIRLASISLLLPSKSNDFNDIKKNFDLLCWKFELTNYQLNYFLIIYLWFICINIIYFLNYISISGAITLSISLWWVMYNYHRRKQLMN